MARAPLIVLCVIGALPFACTPPRVALRRASPLEVTVSSAPPVVLPLPDAPAATRAPTPPPTDTIEEWLWKHPEVAELALTHVYHPSEDIEFMAGAARIGTDTTVCIARIPSDGAPDDSRFALRCYAEPGATLAIDATKRGNPLRLDVDEAGAWLNASLETDAGVLVKVYPCDAGPIYQSAVTAVEKSDSPSHPFDSPPWPASAAADNKDRGKEPPRLASRRIGALAPAPDTRTDDVDWGPLLRAWSGAETRQLWHDGERRLTEVTHEESDVHRLLFRTPLPDNEDGSTDPRWIASATWEFREVVRAVPTPELQENSVGVFLESYDTGSSLEIAYPDDLHFAVLRIMSQAQYDSWRERVGDASPEEAAWPAEDAEDPPYLLLREAAEIHVGEIGFVRLTGTRSHTWRVFHGVRILSEGCIGVKRRVAFTAPFSRATWRFGRQEPLRIRPGDAEDPGARYVGRPGRYRLEGNRFIKKRCGSGGRRAPSAAPR